MRSSPVEVEFGSSQRGVRVNRVRVSEVLLYFDNIYSCRPNTPKKHKKAMLDGLFQFEKRTFRYNLVKILLDFTRKEASSIF